MGLDVNGTRFLLYAERSGVNFSSVAMIGRQTLNLSAADLGRNLSSFGLQADPVSVRRMLGADGGYAEAFFKRLGAKEIHSYDYSAYEGASHLHDMNEPVPEPFKDRYSVVVDGGSLEHVFNFPVGIRNCMEMVRTGGHFLGISPANNFLGHGFYQFSPELYFSIFTEANGYELLDLIVFEDSPEAQWFSVQNPARLKRRVTLINGRPTYLLVMARRTGGVAPFSTTPKQSDYLSAWDSGATSVRPSSSKPGWHRAASALLDLLPAALRTTGRRLRPRGRRGFDPQFFQRMTPEEGTRPAGHLAGPEHK